MVITLVQAIITASKTSSLSFSDAVEYHRDKQRFISTYPQYPDPSLTRLRKREFSRLSQNGGSVYLDYTGASLYPSSLIKSHSKWLKCCVAGNPHSTSPASLLSTRATEDARNAILEFFDADPADYDVVWTSNATAGFRIVGETYDFRGKRMLIPRDAHNSLNSLARKAQAGGGSFEFIEFDQTWSCSSGVEKQDTISRQAYLDALSQPGSSLSSLKNMEQKQQQQQEQDKGLIFFTGQSNITGVKLDMSLLSIAKDLGWNVGLDAAALAPSTRISLRCYPSVDYMVVSLYKICGYPTGVGALIMKKSMYANMTRKETFFGGNIIGITMDKMEFSLVEGSERFEDGTGNFASMAAVASGLKFASRWMSRYTQRNKILVKWLVDQLDNIYYPTIGGVVEQEGMNEKQHRSFSSSTLYKKSSSTSSASSTNSSFKRKRCASQSKGVKLIRIGGPRDLDIRGATLPLVFCASDGTSLNYRFVIWAAAQENISLRGGPCMCNPGASSSVMQRGLITDLNASSLLAVADVGIVRVSLGIASSFKDCWRLVKFCKRLTQKEWTNNMWITYQTQFPGANLANDIDELQARATRKRDT